MSSATVAEARRGNYLHGLQVKLDAANKAANEIALGPGGTPVPYLAQRRIDAAIEAGRIQEEMDQLAALEGAELVKKFCPAPVLPPEGVTLTDMLGRGQMVPQGVVVTTSAR